MSYPSVQLSLAAPLRAVANLLRKVFPHTAYFLSGYLKIYSEMK